MTAPPSYVYGVETMIRQMLVLALLMLFEWSTAVVAPRFYYFDVGIVNYLLHRSSLEPGSTDFGHAFEHLVIQEIQAYLDYHDCEDSLAYWRTDGGYEVDAVGMKSTRFWEMRKSQ